MAIRMVDASPKGPEQVIQGYVPGGFRVSGVVHLGPILVLPDQTSPWAVTELPALGLEAFGPVLTAPDGSAGPAVDILLVGTGNRFTRISRTLIEALRVRGVSADAMDSRAAARTYNVLLGEGRRVAAALLPL